MATYLYCENASRPLVVNGRTYRFEPVAVIGGRLTGVLKAEGQAESDLTPLVGARVGIAQISESEFGDLLKKKTPTPGSKPSLTSNEPAPRAVLPPHRLAPKAGVESAGANDRPQDTETRTLPDPADLIKVEKVNSPDVIVEADKRLATPEAPKPKRQRKAA